MDKILKSISKIKLYHIVTDLMTKILLKVMLNTITLTLILNNKIYHKVRTVPKSNWNRTELEKKYVPAIDNYGQSCFVRSDFLKMKCVCKTQMMPPPDHKIL